jgi:type IV pilus assembly protein PilA
MFCSRCGAPVPEGGRFCNACGQPVAGPVFTPTAPPVAPSPDIVAPAPDAPTSGKALASMISGIFGLIFFFPAIAAIILGHISRSEIRNSNGRLKGLGMSTAGLVMGYGVFAMIPFILIIAAIAIPNLLRARIAANEASAVASIRTIHTAEIAYQVAYPDVGFTCRLVSLGGNAAPEVSAEHAKLIDDVLASGQKHAYRFALENCVNTETEHKYQVIAYPLVHHQTGTRTFCSDESGVIKSGEGQSAEYCLANGTPLE